MSRGRLLTRVLVRAIITTFVAAFLLSFFVRGLLPPPVTDPMYEEGIKGYSDLVGIGVWLASVGIGVLEGFSSWKRYKKGEQSISLDNGE